MDVALVLDVDGVLVDPTRGGLGSWQLETAQHFGLAPEHIPGFFASGWRDVMDGTVTLPSAVAGYFSAVAPAVDADAFIDHWLQTDFVLNESVLQIAQHWAALGVPVYLGTNQEHTRAAFLRERLSMHFSALRDVLYSADLGAAKPSAKFFGRASQRIGAVPVVFVDDALSNVEAATAFGWQAVHYVGQPTFADELAALISDSGRTTPG